MERAVKVLAFITCMLTFLCAGIYAGMWAVTGNKGEWKCVKHAAVVTQSSDTGEKELVFVCVQKELITKPELGVSNGN